jgi:hypothetical protein
MFPLVSCLSPESYPFDRRIRYRSLPGSPRSLTSIRNVYEPDPLTVAMPKIVADVLSALQETTRTDVEWTLMSVAGPRSWYSSSPDGPVPWALPPKVALSPFAWAGRLRRSK